MLYIFYIEYVILKITCAPRRGSCCMAYIFVNNALLTS
jgi:hypothetical protein